MGQRFLLWLGAGAVCAGVTVGMLVGAGTANAQTDSDGDDASKTSQSTKTADTQQDSTVGDAKPKLDRPTAKVVTAVKQAVDGAVSKVVNAAGADDRATATDTTVETPPKPQPGQRAAKFVNNVVAAVTRAPERKVMVERTRPDPVVKPDRSRPSTRFSPVPPNVPYRSRNRRNFEWYGTFARSSRRERT